MEHLSNLTCRNIVPEPARVYKPRIRRIEAPVTTKGTAPVSAAYEAAVFNFLLSRKTSLGIAETWRCKNVRVDGLLDLNNGTRLGLEIKYRMNWEKACQANSQIRWFLNHREAKTRRLTSAIVVFEEFSGDWARKAPSRFLENGWNYWYTDHHDLDGFRVDLVRLRADSFESFFDALDAARAARDEDAP